MKFEANALYHIYNRGNNKQTIFPKVANYEFFLNKVQKLLCAHCDIIAFCLMPNHFHFLIHTNENSIRLINSGDMQMLSRKLGTLQSSYTRAINIQEETTGTLFQQKYKSILLSDEHAINCFHYIHQNPVKANLVLTAVDWKYSSFQEYFKNAGNICNQQLAHSLLQIPNDRTKFFQESNEVVSCGKVFLNLSEDDPS